jgi:hypothetical protein
MKRLLYCLERHDDLVENLEIFGFDKSGNLIKIR